MDRETRTTFEDPVATGSLLCEDNSASSSDRIRVTGHELIIVLMLSAISCVIAVVSFAVCCKIAFVSFPSDHIGV